MFSRDFIITMASLMLLSLEVQAFHVGLKTPIRVLKQPLKRISTKNANSMQMLSFGPSRGMIDTFFQTYPYLSAFLTTGFKASLADLAAQTRSNVRERNKDDGGETKPFQFLRNLAFLLYGGLYQGCAQHFFYNIMLPTIFGEGRTIGTVLCKVLFDALILTPILCLPSAYLTKAIVFRYSLKEGLSRYIYDVKKNRLLFKYWALWAPVQCLTFGVIPVHYRIAFIAVVSFFWLMILSSLTAKSDAIREAKQAESETIESNNNIVEAS